MSRLLVIAFLLMISLLMPVILLVYTAMIPIDYKKAKHEFEEIKYMYLDAWRLYIKGDYKL